MIQHYSFGRLNLQGQLYTSDLIILPHKIIHPWWRKSGHKLILADLEELWTEQIEALVVGTGFFGLMRVAKEVAARCQKEKIKLYTLKTGEAVKLFNSLSNQALVAGAFHLTC